MSIRAFLAIDLDPTLRAALARFQEECRRILPTLQWVNPKSLHLTIKFLGYIPETDIEAIRETLTSVISPLPPFSVTVEGIGAFPALTAPRSLWAGITGETGRLETLVALVEQALEPLGYPRESKPFRAHLTLARVKGRHREIREIGATLEKVAWIHHAPRFGELQVDRLCLFQSELRPTGAEYHRLWDIALQGT